MNSVEAKSRVKAEDETVNGCTRTKVPAGYQYYAID